MNGDNFNYPPGVLPVSHWTARVVQFKESFADFVRAVQQDAIMAERKSNAATLVRWTEEANAANNAAHKEKVCRCVLTSTNRHNVYNYGGVTICGYCERPIL